MFNYSTISSNSFSLCPTILSPLFHISGILNAFFTLHFYFSFISHFSFTSTARFLYIICTNFYYIHSFYFVLSFRLCFMFPAYITRILFFFSSSFLTPPPSPHFFFPLSFFPSVVWAYGTSPRRRSCFKLFLYGTA